MAGDVHAQDGQGALRGDAQLLCCEGPRSPGGPDPGGRAYSPRHRPPWVSRGPAGILQQHRVCSRNHGRFLPGASGVVNLDFRPLPSIQAKLKAIETLTAVGIRYVPQPIESCFEPTIWKNGAGASDGDSSGCGFGDSGYGSSSLHHESARVPPPNRTFANEWIAVRRSPLGGYGIFAARDIPRNTHFLLERPFIHISGYSELATKYDELGEEEKLVYDGLHRFDRTSDDPVKKRWNANRYALSLSRPIFFSRSSSIMYPPASSPPPPLRLKKEEEEKNLLHGRLSHLVPSLCVCPASSSTTARPSSPSPPTSTTPATRAATRSTGGTTAGAS